MKSSFIHFLRNVPGKNDDDNDDESACACMRVCVCVGVQQQIQKHSSVSSCAEFSGLPFTLSLLTTWHHLQGTRSGADMKSDMAGGGKRAERM